MTFVLFLIVLLCPTVGWGQSISASATAYPFWSNSSTCVAPCAVLFDAQASEHSQHTADEAWNWKSLRFEWDFRDTNCTEGVDVWEYGNPNHRDKCSDLGPIAGHVYEAAGTYYATVTVSYPGAASDTANTSTFTVVSPDTYYSGSNTRCIACNATPTPGSEGCPSGATPVNAGPSCNFHTQLGSGTPTANTRYLFRRGDTFNQSSPVVLSNDGVFIGAFGDANNPIPEVDCSNSYSCVQAGNDVRIQDIYFDGVDAANSECITERRLPGENDYPDTHNVVLHRIRVTDCASYIDLEMSGPNTAKTFWDEIVNVGVFESTFASRPYGISWFIYAQRFLAMGNSLESVDVAEHQIRMPFVRPGVTAHNYVGPITGGTLGLQLKYHGDITSTAADENRPDYAGHHVVSDNHLHTGSNEHVAEITGSGGGQNTHIERFRFERNYMTVNGTSDSFHAGLYIGARDSLVADNIVLFNAAGTPPWMGYRCYMKSDQGSPADGIWFVNNTCAGDDNGNYPGWGAVCVHVSSYCTNSVAKNNLFYMPNMADSQTHVFREDAATDDSNNVEASSNPFVVGAGSWNDPNDLQITLNSDAEGAGVKQDMVLDDYGLRTRDPNDADVGAWAYNIVTDANAPPTVTVSTSTDPDPPEGFSPLTIDVTGTVTGGSGNIDWKLDCEDDDGTWDDTATNTDTTHDFSVDCVYTSNATLEVQATRSGVTDNDLTSVTINTPTITVTTSTDPAPAGPSPLTLTVTGTFTGTAEGDIDWKLDCKDDDATWDQEVTDANEIYTFSTTCEYTEDDTLEIQGTRLGVTDNDLTAVNITTYGDNLLTNPGAEDPNCLGWTLVGTNTANFSCATECLPQPQCPSTDPNSAVGPYSGSYVFTWAAPTATDDWARQDVDVSAYAVDIDAGDVNLKAGCYAVCGECQSGYDQYQVDVYLYDGNDVQLAQPHNGALTDEECSWTWEGVEDYNLPANTRTVRVEFQTIEPPSWAAGKVDDCEVRLDTTSPITFGISATTDPNDAAGPHPLVLTATGIVDPNTTATGNIDWKLDCEDDDGTWDDQATNTDTTHEFGTTCSYTGDAVLQVQATRAGITDNEYIDVDYLGTSPGIDWVDNGGQEDANGPTDPNLPGGFPARSVSRLYPVLSDATMRGGMYRPRQHVGREGRMSAPH